MLRIISALSILTLIAACGGGTRYSSANAVGARAAPTVLYATGPIAQACRGGGRKQASRARCGCVQAVANRSLSAADQRRGARFFNNPQHAQDIRQSDNASNERFWKAWKAFGDDAARLCT